MRLLLFFGTYMTYMKHEQMGVTTSIQNMREREKEKDMGWGGGGGGDSKTLEIIEKERGG